MGVDCQLWLMRERGREGDFDAERRATIGVAVNTTGKVCVALRRRRSGIAGAIVFCVYTVKIGKNVTRVIHWLPKTILG